MRVCFAILLFFIVTFTPATRADDPPAAIRGKAFIAGSDLPAANVTLHFLDRDVPRLSLVTDAAGRFRGTVPAGVAVAEGQDGESGPPCWMEPFRCGWQSIRFAPFLQPDYARKLVCDAIRKPVKTIWCRRGGVLNLEVKCPPTGVVEVLVRSAAGAPLADRPVQVVLDQSTTDLHMPVAVQLDGRTDAAGQLRVGWFEGMLRLKVVVPGEGFSSTGLFEVRSDLIVRQEVPPLARFSSIEGRLDPTLVRPSMTVVLERQGQALAESACDAEGRFALRDVSQGTYWLRPMRAGEPAGSASWVRVTPGQRISAVAIRPAQPAPAQPPRNRILETLNAPAGLGKEIVWFEGTVRDEKGRGVTGAHVFACTTINHSLRTYEQAQVATTDYRGHYEVRGPLEQMWDSRLIAHAEGGPPAALFVAAPGNDGRPVAVDLTLPDASRGGSLRVTVLKDGRPLAGAHVGLAPTVGDTPLSAANFGGPAGPGNAAMHALSHPLAVAGRDGVARFTGLLPGSYELTARDLRDKDIPAEFVPNVTVSRARNVEENEVAAEGREPVPIFARARGVTVVEGRETAFVVAIHPQACTARVQVSGPDGKPPARRSVELRFGLSTPSASTTLDLDRFGVGRYDFALPGLWGIEVRFRDTASEFSRINTEPFYRAEALVPISPGLALDEPIRLVGVRRELGSLRIRLLDRDGRPARGTVLIIGPPEEPEYGATADDRGVVVFQNMASGEYQLRGYIDGLSAPVPDTSRRGPIPEAAALRGHSMVPLTTAAVAAGREAAVELRARPVGYVRGALRPAKGHKTADYHISPAFESSAVGSVAQFDPESGEFLHGPILPGKVGYVVTQSPDDRASPDKEVQNVEVPAGDVVHVEFRPGERNPAPAADTGQDALPAKGFVPRLERDPEAVVRTVVLDDGKTPAFAARSLLFVPGEAQPVKSGLSDLTGRLTWRGLWIWQSAETKRRPGLVDQPTVVAWIPGRTGRAIVRIEPGRPVSVTLPAPRSAQGRVTLGRRPVDARNARIHVVAAHRGRGLLDDMLSLDVTAQADGRFELRGLTPGRYDVQAARDGIWLSQTIELTVADDRDPPPIALDIPEPGRAVELQVVDREDRPLAERPIGLVRPQGPLASLWPAILHTGTDGVLTLRGLEAGRHTVLIGDEKRRHEIAVPAADEAPARPVVERIVVP
jgi:hypothetical protein